MGPTASAPTPCIRVSCPPCGRPTPDPAAREVQVGLTSLRRLGQSMEVAYDVLFLASDAASFITGTELVIDGGFLAR